MILTKSGPPSKETYFLTFATTYWTFLKIKKIRDIKGGRSRQGGWWVGSREGCIWSKKEREREKKLCSHLHKVWAVLGQQQYSVWHHSGLYTRKIWVLPWETGKKYLEREKERLSRARSRLEKKTSPPPSLSLCFRKTVEILLKGKKGVPGRAGLFLFSQVWPRGPADIKSWSFAFQRFWAPRLHTPYLWWEFFLSHTTAGPSCQELLWSSISRWRSA